MLWVVVMATVGLDLRISCFRQLELAVRLGLHPLSSGFVQQTE